MKPSGRSRVASVLHSMAVLMALLPSANPSGVQAPNHGSAAAPVDARHLPQPVNWTTAEDHRNMMEQLGIKMLRPGPSGNENAPNHANYSESKANPYPILPDGQLAWRQYDGGHTDGPNWKYFIPWADRFLKHRPAAVSLASSPVPARIPPDQPVPRTDQNSKIAHAQLLEKARRCCIDIYFEGDSITRRWGATDYPALLANWNQNFFGWNAANFGWGGDTIQNILWRLSNGELDGVNPRLIVLLAGTNDVGNAVSQASDDTKVADITMGLQAILHIMQAKAPNATIILTGIFPRNDNMAAIPVINRINDNLSRLADGRTIRYLNINDRLADKDGNLYGGMMDDKLHPTIKGYQVWADALKPIFTQLIGPPKSEDHAPPPTGDPKAQSSPSPARP